MQRLNNNLFRESEIIFDQKTKGIFGINKSKDLVRLIFEISIRNSISPEKIFNNPTISNTLENSLLSQNKKFDAIKSHLVSLRFPNCYDKYDDLFIGGVSKKEDFGTDMPVTSDKFEPLRIFIENGAKDSILSKRVCRLFPNSEIIQLTSLKEYKSFRKKIFSKWKQDLFITNEKFDFFKDCPCTKGAVSCGYKIFNIGFGCPFDCTYCYLQEYTNFPGIILQANIEDYLKAFSWSFKGKEKLRIGTGEFADSLALDHVSEYSKTLVPFFGGTSHTLELKTKSANINNLKGLNHNGQTVISWSLNPQKIIDSDEHKSASLSQRLEAMEKTLEWGYRVAAHFDPIIFYPGYLDDYKEVIDKLFKTSKGKLSWISLGTFRFRPGLKSIIEERFPETRYIYEEFILDWDKKARYFPNLRVDIYKNISKLFNKFELTPVYLCMEKKSIWEKIDLESKALTYLSSTN